MRSRLTVAGLVIALLLGTSIVGVSSEAAIRFKNCTELNKAHKFGVSGSKSWSRLTSNRGDGPVEQPKFSSSIYKANVKLDSDKDGAICEVVNKGLLDGSKPQHGASCNYGIFAEVGYTKNGRLTYLTCSTDGKWVERLDGPAINQKTGLPIRKTIPERSRFIEFPTLFWPANEVGYTGKTKISEPSQFLNVEPCRIPDGDPRLTHFSSGFPIHPDRAKLTEPLKVVFAAVDFSDLPATTSPRLDYKDVTGMLESFWGKTSTRPVEFEFVFPQKYVRMSRSFSEYDLIADYFQGGFTPQKQEKYWAYTQAAIDAVDPQIDFTGADVVVIAGPPNYPDNTVFVADSQRIWRTNEGSVRNNLIRGTDLPRDLWNWTHEFGHSLGLTDIRNTVDVGNQKNDGMGAFDLMASPVAPEILVWHRFLLGVLGDRQIHCITDQTDSTHLLRPVAMTTEELKGIVIPTGKYTGIVVESRRNMGYDISLGRESEGVMVYKLDTTIPYRYSPVKIVSPARSRDRQMEFDSILKPGESVSIQGWTIRVLESGAFGDVVQVIKQ
ncbi:MAG: hypothetical protein RIR89_421 [Actinomycetota bacterium]|jgi:M6 family metalloprotease-like protein